MSINKLEICKRTRKIAADSFYKALKDLLWQDKPISEVDLRDAWLLELRKHEEIFPDGWYIPPPHGIGVLFATDDDFDRSNYPTLRKEKYWPKSDVFLNRQKGIVMTYASPVSNKEGTIGDFGLDLYLGKNEKVIQHFNNVYKTVHTIFNNLKIGMKLSELFQYEYKVFAQNELTNKGWISINDPTGINVGHTVPFFDESELTLDWTNSCQIISKKRKFINAIEQTEIVPGMALTIEPRVKSTTNKDLPTIYFHTIVLIHENGEKELLKNFDEIFKLANMNYLLKTT